MNFDLDGHLSAMERSVSSLMRDGQPARAVTLSRIYSTPVENLWDAVTNIQRIPRWAMPISGDLRLGGRYQLEGNAGGTITTCQQLSDFTLTWEFAGDVSWVKVGLSATKTGESRLTITHTALLSEHWDTYGPGAVGVGWETALLGLALHIARPDMPKPDEVEFVTSQDGRAFISESSESWGQASIEAGTSPEDAEAAARRTTAFYTGESAISD